MAEAIRPSGCFALVDDDDSPWVTAFVVEALRDFTWDGYVNAAYLAAVACLESKQHSDGSFGSEAVTAQAALALLGAKGNHSASVSNARANLLFTQRSDGSWAGSVCPKLLPLRNRR